MFFQTQVSSISNDIFEDVPRSRDISPQIQAVAKRVLDVIFSLVTLVLLSPLLLLISLLIKFESPGPVLFRQLRNGKSGKTFEILKFRTMMYDPKCKFEQCVPADRRVTYWGKLLRKTSIDELPQLINVLQGDMSIVGPRPHAVEHDNQFSSVLPFYMNRYNVRPGITGLAQVLGFRGPTPTKDVMARRFVADLRYMENQTLLLDLLIIIRTLPAVLVRRNAC